MTRIAAFLLTAALPTALSAQVTITSLPTASTLTGSEVSPVVQTGSTKQTTVSSIVQQVKVAPTSGTVSRTIPQHLADEPNVLDYGADPTGVNDSATAINAAINAAAVNKSIAIRVPKGVYKIGSIPWGSAYRNIRINAEPGVAWTGAGATNGAGQLSSEWIFSHPLTNPYNATSGPSLNCFGLPQNGSGAPGTNVTQCWSTELSGPRGAGATGKTGLLGYIGIDSGDSIDDGNVGEAVNIVANLRNADNPVPNFGMVGLEIDMNVDVRCRKNGTAQGWASGYTGAPGSPGGPPSCSGYTGAPDNADKAYTFTGLFVDSGGAGGPLQAPLGGIGVQVKRDAGAWANGFSCVWAQTCLETQAYDHALLVHTEYENHSTNDPYCPSGTYSSSCAIRGGIYFDNAPYWQNTLFAGRQLANGSDAIVLSRSTDSASTGYFLRFKNRANNADLFSVGVDGGVRLPGYTVANLPSSPETGEIVMVTDASIPTWGGALIGGGTTKCIAFYNGTAWVAQ